MNAEESNSRRLRELAEKPVGRLLWQYSLPAVTGMLVMALYNVIDRMFIGQGVGPEAIAGLAFTFPVMNLSTALGVLIGVGSSARLSVLLGAGDNKGAHRIVGNELVLTLVIGVAYVALFGIFLRPMLEWFGADEVTLPYAYDFLLPQLPAMLMANITYSFNNVMRSTGYPGCAMVTMLIGAAVNIALDPIFIFSLGMGIKGAAIATDIAMGVSMIFVLAHFLRKDVTVSFRRATYRLHGKTIWEITSIGAAPFLVNVAGCLINILIVHTISRYNSTSDLAAMGIFVTFTSLLVTVILGICQGLQPILGYNYGAGKTKRLKKVFMYAVWASTAICFSGSLMGWFCPELIARVFSSDEGLVTATSSALRLAISAFATVGFQIISTCLFQSLNFAGRSIFLSLCRQVIFLIPLLLWLPELWGLKGVWSSFPLADLCSFTVSVIMVSLVFRRIARKGA